MSERTRDVPALAVGQIWAGSGMRCQIIDLGSPWPDMVTTLTPKAEISYVVRKEFGMRLHYVGEAEPNG